MPMDMSQVGLVKTKISRISASQLPAVGDVLKAPIQGNTHIHHGNVPSGNDLADTHQSLDTASLMPTLIRDALKVGEAVRRLYLMQIMQNGGTAPAVSMAEAGADQGQNLRDALRTLMIDPSQIPKEVQQQMRLPGVSGDIMDMLKPLLLTRNHPAEDIPLVMTLLQMVDPAVQEQGVLQRLQTILHSFLSGFESLRDGRSVLQVRESLKQWKMGYLIDEMDANTLSQTIPHVPDEEGVAQIHAMMVSLSKRAANQYRNTDVLKQVIQEFEQWAKQESQYGNSTKQLMDAAQILGKTLGLSKKAVDGYLGRVLEAIRRESLNASETVLQEPASSKLLSLVEKSARGQAEHSSVQSLCQDAVRGFAESYSLLHPLIHFILPVAYGRTATIGELWVDPEWQDEEEKGSRVPKIRVLLTIEILESGHIEVDLVASGNKLTMRLFCPKEMKADIDAALPGIIKASEGHGYTALSASVAEWKRKRSLTDVFGKTVERKVGFHEWA